MNTSRRPTPNPGPVRGASRHGGRFLRRVPARVALSAVLSAALILCLAVPPLPAAERSDRHDRCAVRSRVVRSAVLLLKDITVEVARAERECAVEVSRASLEAVAAVTDWLSRIGALRVTILDVPLDGRLSDGS